MTSGLVNASFSLPDWQAIKMIYFVGRISLLLIAQSHSTVYVVVQFYPWFKFYFLLFQTRYHTLPYPKTKENKI